MNALKRTILICCALLLLPAIGLPDDRDLLRFGSAKPYVFILLDTSVSMSLAMGPSDSWVPGGADNPDSRLYQAKQALYDVFSAADDVHFGFASYNQDRVRAVGKHWLYFLPAALDDWPLTFPRPEIDGALTTLIDTLEDTNGDGIPDTGDGIPDARVGAISGDVLTLGTHMPISPVGQAGSCTSPLDLGSVLGRRRAQAFAMEASILQPSILWLKEGTRTYRLQVSQLSTSPPFGVSPMPLTFYLRRVVSCQQGTFDLSWTRVAPVVLDSHLNQVFISDQAPTTSEATAGLWPWTDIVSQADFGSSRPFTGNGWEGNYDSGVVTGSPPFDNLVTNVDRFCVGNTCTQVKPFAATAVSAIGRPLDSGDVLPFHWNDKNKEAFLRRLAPNRVDPLAAPDFGVATYFADLPVQGLHLPRQANVRPLAAADESPLAKAINDFRCWYLGRDGSGAAGKCRNSAFYDRGWQSYGCEFDTGFGCRRTFFIIVSDGEDTPRGEDANADVAAMNSQAGIETWAVNLADPRDCTSGGGLHPIVRAGGGECVTVSNRSELTSALRSILGELREESRAFASAAVPGVQATVDQQIFLSTFLPLNGESVWDGHLLGFLKPLPLVDSQPDITQCRNKADSESACMLWDAGAQLLTTPGQAASLAEAANPAKRRVLYSAVPAAGTWVGERRLLNATGPTTPAAARYDLWTGLGIPFALDDPDLGLDSSAQNRANAILAETFAVKTSTVDRVDPDTGGTTSQAISYLLGDTFHSGPLVIGQPPSTGYFGVDLFADRGDPDASCDSGDNTGYRCFYRRHQNRRKVLVVGANDGMLHAFDAGNYRVSGTDPATGGTLDNQFDNGTGKELFGYVPRAAMPSVTLRAEGDSHHYGVDGEVAGADAFLDPVHAGTPDPDDREWRTLLVGGLREGGSGYFALDVTQPDRLTYANGKFVPQTMGAGNHVPSCTANYSAAACGPVPYPAALWEFTDSAFDATLLPPVSPLVRLDEDRNGVPDLAATWSKPALGRIQVCRLGGTACNPNDEDNNSDVEERFVAIFGGGMDVASKITPQRALQGNWLYIVDLETGQPLYKAKLEDSAGNSGAAPSAPAAVDTDQDGVLDRIYIGTVAGRLYRLDLTPDDMTGDLPALTDPGTKFGLNGLLYPVAPRIDPRDWAPRIVFDTLGPASSSNATLVRRPLYHPPAVLFVAKLGLYALAFGTGDREDLWAISAQDGRFYVVVDDTDRNSDPIEEVDLIEISLISDDVSIDYLAQSGALPGTRGWYFRLAEEERVITDTFSLAGITIFSSFIPRILDEDGSDVEPGCSARGPGNGGGNGGGGGGGSSQPQTCSRVGNSHLFAVNTTNGNGLLRDTSLRATRSVEVDNFVSDPYAESGTTKVTGSGSSSDTTDELDARLTAIMEGLKELFPSNCRFANYRVDIRTVAADTSIRWIAPVPVCLVDKNWKEF